MPIYIDVWLKCFKDIAHNVLQDLYAVRAGMDRLLGWMGSYPVTTTRAPIKLTTSMCEVVVVLSNIYI